MTPRLVGALVLAPVVAGAADGFPDMASVHSKCYSLLTGLSASQYNTDELALLCRQHLPMEVCRAEAKELGAKPWSPSTIGRVCGKWEEDWTQRALQMTPEERQLEAMDFQKQIDEIMQQKAAVGLCKDQPTVDQCAAWKKEEYPKYQKQLNDVYREKRESWKGGADSAKAEIKEAADDAGDKMQDEADTVQGAFGDAGDAVGDAAQSAQDAAGDATASVADAVDDATGKFEKLKLGHEKAVSSSTTPSTYAAAGAAVLGVWSFAAVACVKRAMNHRALDSQVESDAELTEASS